MRQSQARFYSTGLDLVSVPTASSGQSVEPYLLLLKRIKQNTLLIGTCQINKICL